MKKKKKNKKKEVDNAVRSGLKQQGNSCEKGVMKLTALPNCPYGIKSTDPAFCSKCNRCTDVGFNAFMALKPRKMVTLSRAERSFIYRIKGERNRENNYSTY